MGVYKKAVITNAGRALMARSITGEIAMQFSRVVTSSRIYPSDTDFKGYTSLEGVQQTVIPSNVQIVNDTMVSVRSLFGNESMSESYLIQNIGLYATDGNEEILFSVSQATNPDEMPAYNGVAPSSFIYTIQATVSQANSLSLTINSAGTATTQDIVDLDGAKLDKQGDISETVVNTLETSGDKFPIPSAGDKIKSFLGKVLTFLRNIKPLEADATYYVATTGSDTTGDGTNTKPFKTIQRTVDVLPKNLGGHAVTINIASGTYPEALNICGFYAGSLIVTGSDASTTIVNGGFEQHKIYNCSASTSVYGLTFKAPTIQDLYIGVAGITNCTSISILNCKVDGTNTVHPASPNHGLIFIASISEIENVEFNNCATCLYTPYYDNMPNPPSLISASKLSGINNLYSSAMNGGQLMYKDSTRPLTIYESIVDAGGILVKSSGAIIGTLSDDVTYYVTTTGSDVTGNGTSAKPFKTVKKVLNTLPKDLGGHTATINIAGGTYDEDVYISGFYSSTGRIMIYLPDNVVIRGLIVSGSHVIINSSNSIPHNLTVQYILAQDTATLNIWAQINVTTTGYIIDQITTTSKVSIIVTRNSTLYLSGVTTITGNDGTGVFVINTSYAYIDTINGNGLNVGMHSVTGSNICIRNNSILAVSPYAQTNCGSFTYGNGTQISNIISSGLSCTWGIIRGGYFRHGNINGTAVVTVHINIATTTALTTGVQYSIYGFPRPLDTNDLAVFCAEKYFEHAWLFAPDGTIKVIPGVNIPTNTVVLLSITYLTNS